MNDMMGDMVQNLRLSMPPSQAKIIQRPRTPQRETPVAMILELHMHAKKLHITRRSIEATAKYSIGLQKIAPAAPTFITDPFPSS